MGTQERTPARAGLLWAALGGLACALVAPLEPNLLEEGFIVHAAERMARGERLFSDIASFTGPLPFEALAVAFRAFGESIWLTRALVVALQAAASAAAWGIGRQAAGSAGGHAAAACVAFSPVLMFPFFSFYFYTTIGVQLAWLACYAALRGTSSLAWATGAGVLVACIALSKQTVGAALAASLFVSTLACAPAGRRLRLALGVAQGGLAVALLSCAYYAWTGQLAPMVHWIVDVPLAMPQRFGSPYMNFWPIGEFGPETDLNRILYIPWLFSATSNPFTDKLPVWLVIATQVGFALPPLSIAATLLLRVRGPLPTALWVHFAVLLAVATNLFPRSDWGHLAFVLPSALAHTALVALCAAASLPRRRRTQGAAVLVGALALASLASGARLYQFAEPPNLGPRVPLWPVSHMARSPAVARVVEYIRSNAAREEPIYVARSEPLIYYATETSNPTPFGYTIPGMPEMQERPILDALAEVRFIAMSDIDQPFYNYYRDELPQVHAYLERHFAVPVEFQEKSSDWMIVLERDTDRGPAVLDLVEAAAAGRRWVRESARLVRPSHEPIAKVAVRQNRRPLLFWLAKSGGGIDLDITVPEGAVFQADVGYPAMVMADKSWDHPPRGRLEVSVDGGEGFETVLSQRVVNPTRRSDRILLREKDPGRRWLPVEVDLAAYAGRDVTLRLAFVPEGSIQLPALGWFGSPRIVVARPAPGAPGTRSGE